MLKSNILTPVLSGVLAVTVAGSGVLYVLDKKDSSKTSTDNKSDTVLAKVSDKINAAAEKIDKTVKGETDTGYSLNAELSFGDFVTKQSGTAPAPISLKADSKVKGTKSETDLELAYNSNSLATLCLITDTDTGTMYLRCPELNDAYLSISSEDIETLLEQSGVGGSMLSQFRTISPAIGMTSMAAASAQPDLSKLQDVLKDIDFEALSKDLEEYVQVVKDAIPEGEAKDNITGEIAGNSFEYEVKTIDVTVSTVTDVAKAVLEKAKTDALIKGNLSKLDITEADYDKLIDSVLNTLSNQADKAKDQKLCSVDIFSYEGEEVGFDLNVEGQGSIKLVLIDNSELFAIDCSADIGGTNMTMNGAFTNTDDALNGSVKLNIDEEDENANMTFSVNDLRSVGDYIAGSAKLEVNAQDKSFTASLDSASTEDKADMTLQAAVDGDNIFKLNITGEQTEASDVTVPSGTIYKFNKEDMSAYEKSCKIDEFKEHIKAALGDEIWNKLSLDGNAGSNIMSDGIDSFNF